MMLSSLSVTSEATERLLPIRAIALPHFPAGKQHTSQKVMRQTPCNNSTLTRTGLSPIRVKVFYYNEYAFYC